MRIFAVVPKVTSLNLRNAGQLKDEVMDYILERKVPLVHLQLDAANLISDAKWREFFEKSGKTLRSLKVSWLDNSFDDETVGHMVRGCPNLRRFKMKKCFKPGDASLEALAGLGHLEHLSLRFTAPTTGPALLSLVRSVGPNLVTLSLEGFENADDGVLSEIHASCRKLAKLRFTDNDYCTDAALTALFTDWANPPLSFLDLSKTRDLDYSNPGGPEQPVGLASNGFKALMAHSGSRLEHLDISSCRHIAYGALADVFDGKRQYPQLKRINLSFLTTIDGFVGTGLFRSCPALQQVTVFGCFAMDRVAVPAGVALIGVPNAHESIVQEG
jgi:DNA repair protein RAD7